jgi:hypothetical protein
MPETSAKLYVHEFGTRKRVWEMDRSKMPNGYLEDAWKLKRDSWERAFPVLPLP